MTPGYDSTSLSQVIGHIKDALFLTLDDLHLWLVDGVGSVLDQLEHVADALRVTVGLLQDSQISRITVSGLDDILSRLEEATAHYLPLPPTLREWNILENIRTSVATISPSWYFIFLFCFQVVSGS